MNEELLRLKLRIKEIKTGIAEGSIINIGDAEKLIFNTARKCRNAILNIPDKLCDEFVAISRCYSKEIATDKIKQIFSNEMKFIFEHADGEFSIGIAKLKKRGK